MKVYKFGGASINNIERMQNTAAIIGKHAGEKLLVVISAMGKTTNALEKVAEAFFSGNREDALLLFQRIKKAHLDTVKYLINLNWQAAEKQLSDFFTEVEWLLHDQPVKGFDYYYDQVVASGELMSTAIMGQYLKEKGVNLKWVDVRDILRTDNNYRDAGVNWEITEKHIQEKLLPLFTTYDVVLTQGFIGATDENETTTLGREGSDYSAAIFANLIQAKSVTIWKDVDAVMSADPRLFPDATIISTLSFTEVIEMAYYGAQVIHPKTIKPLQNKNIPLFVKSFIDPNLPGTAITGNPVKQLPPLIVIKPVQVLLRFRSKDFSFVEDEPLQKLQELFSGLKYRPNLIQNTAISLLCCFTDHPEKMGKLASAAAAYFDVEVEKGLQLLTIRHYDEKTINKLTEGKDIILLQKTTETLQALYRI